jgi:ethanolamine permease
VTAVFIAAMYACFIFSFTELTTSIPHAGGPFAYSKAAFGPVGGYIAGAATLIEFVFAPPAIALAIGAYLNVQFPAVDPKTAAVGAYIVFMALNIVGVQIAATFELLSRCWRSSSCWCSWAWSRRASRWPTSPRAAGRDGQLQLWPPFPACSPRFRFAIWFFLAIEGVAMAAEEAKDPKRSIPIAYITGILTLVVLAIGVMVFAGGAGDWTKLANINDPLPQAMKLIVGENSNWLHMLVWLGCSG